MRTSIVLVALIVSSLMPVIGGCSSSPGGNAPTDTKQSETSRVETAPYRVVLNITRGKDDLHAVSMAVALGIHSLENGHASVIFLNVHAPELATKDLGDDVLYADFPPVREMFTTFMQKGGILYACEHCTGCCGVESEDLLEGIIVTKHGELLAELDSNSLVFSY
jgi:predicted peroxiredoxin